jgi:hypothetical protein
MGTTLYRPLCVHGEHTSISFQRARWHDPQCEAFDCHHLPDANWQREANKCNPPWGALPTLGAKLRLSGAAVTLISPNWLDLPWFQQLHGMTIGPSTTMSRATSSSQDGKEYARGSGDKGGASRPCSCHAGPAALSQKLHRQMATCNMQPTSRRPTTCHSQSTRTKTHSPLPHSGY